VQTEWRSIRTPKRRPARSAVIRSLALRQSHALEPAQDSANQSAPCRTPLSGTGIVAAEWRGMIDSQMVGPGSGQVLATEVEVPGAGWP